MGLVEEKKEEFKWRAGGILRSRMMNHNMMGGPPMMNNVGGDPLDYMEQEEEWEREGLLDPAWEKQQKKVSPYFVLD